MLTPPWIHIFMRFAGPAPCGMCFAHNWQHGGTRGYGSSTAASSLDELRKLGVKTISLTPFGWMSSTRAVDVKWSTNFGGSETFARLRRTAADARQSSGH